MSTTFTATVDHAVHTTSRVTVRTHTVLVDRPRAKGGNDLGPVGGEYLLVSLGGCFTSHLLAAMRARESALAGIRVTVTGTLDGTPERFTALALDVIADDPDRALLDKLVTIAARGCQVMNTLRLAVPVTMTSQGSPIELEAGVGSTGG